MSRSDRKDATRVTSGRNGVVIAIALLIGNLSNYVFQVTAGRQLSVEGYGLLSGLIAVITVITVATSALQTIAARALAAGEYAARTRHFDGLTRSALLGAAAVCIAGALVSPLVGKALDVSVLPLLLIAAYVVPATIDSIAAGRLQGTRRFAGLATYSATQAIAKLSFAIAVLALGAGSFGVLGAITASCALVAAIGLHATASAGAVDTHALGAESRRAFAAITLFWIMLSVDLPIARARFDQNAAGIYAAAAVMGKAVLWLPLVVTQLVFPSLAMTETSWSESRSLLRRAGAIVVLLAVVAVAALGFFGGTMYRVIYGERYQDAADIAWVIGLAVTPWTIVNLLMFQRLARKRGDFLKWFVALAVVESVALLVVPPSGRWFAATIGVIGVLALGVLLIPQRISSETPRLQTSSLPTP